jgi:hypothetical protein
MTTTYKLFINNSNSDCLVTTETSIDDYVYISSRECDTWYEAYYWLVTVGQNKTLSQLPNPTKPNKSSFSVNEYIRQQGQSITLLNQKVKEPLLKVYKSLDKEGCIKDYIYSNSNKNNFNIWSFSSLNQDDKDKLPDTLFDVNEKEKYMVCVYSPYEHMIGTKISIDVSSRYFDYSKKSKVNTSKYMYKLDDSTSYLGKIFTK